MGYRDRRFGAQRVALPDGYWVDLVPVAKQGTVDVGVAMAAATTDSERAQVSDELLVRCIHGWNLDTTDGGALPVTVETVADLHPADYALLTLALKGILTPLADQETRRD